MSIVHMDKIWVEIAKNFEMRTSGGRGGSLVISDTPGRGRGRGVKKEQIFADVLYGWPPGSSWAGFILVCCCQSLSSNPENLTDKLSDYRWNALNI